jgi:hypothetical protein
MRCSKLFLGLLAGGVLAAAVLLGQLSQPIQAGLAAPSKAAQPAAVAMVEAANQLLAGLSPELRARAAFAFDDPYRLTWHYYPVTPWARKGAVLKEMTPQEKDLVKALLRAGTSPAGYKTALGVMSLENILRDIENTPLAHKIRNSDLYYVSIYGKPALTGKWGWRLEGHHLIFNYVLEDGRVVASTPQVVGANPGEVPSGPYQGLRVLAREEDLARQLLTALDPDSRRKALLAEQAPFDVLSEVKVQPKKLPLEGLAFADMSPVQQQLVRELIRLYAGRQPPEAAERLLNDVEEGGLEKVHFGWAGSPQPGQPHYYRVQGPTFVIEFCNAQNQANHSHAVYRSYKGDFGIPLAEK